MTEKPLQKCPKCGKKVKRLISSGAGFIFKGSGFYITDYKKNSTAVSPATTTKPKTETQKEKKEIKK